MRAWNSLGSDFLTNVGKQMRAWNCLILHLNYWIKTNAIFCHLAAKCQTTMLMANPIFNSDWLELAKTTNSMLCNLMTGGCIVSEAFLEDYRTPKAWGLPKVANFFKKMRKRIYGVLLYDKPNVPKYFTKKGKQKFKIHVEEFCMTGPGSLDKPRKAFPVLSKDCVYYHPGLQNLWKNANCRKKGS